MSSSTQQYFVSGIDTGAGKTLVAAILTQGLRATYWKPVQTGYPPDSDTETVRKLAPDAKALLPEAYRYALPQSPHWAAAAEGKRIDPESLKLPEVTGPLILEGAGGLMVPLNEESLIIDWLARLQLPVVLVVRLYLGCINHSLLSVLALQQYNLPLAGIVFSGNAQPEVQQAILEYSGAHCIGRVPELPDFRPATLQQVFDEFRLPNPPAR